jgi:hypothetical protein
MAVRNYDELGPSLRKILNRLATNQKLLKYLYYTDVDPLSQPDITSEQIKSEIMEHLITLIPRLEPRVGAKSVISLRVVNSATDSSNNQFMGITLAFEIFVPLTQWFIKGDNLRPFSIMGELSKSLKGKTVDGLGKIDGGNFALNYSTDEMSCYEQVFTITTYD